MIVRSICYVVRASIEMSNAYVLERQLLGPQGRDDGTDVVRKTSSPRAYVSTFAGVREALDDAETRARADVAAASRLGLRAHVHRETGRVRVDVHDHG